MISIAFIRCENKSTCKINPDNANRKIYNEEEAACFILLKLDDKTLDLNQIQTALAIEFNYMKEIGLVSENKLTENQYNSSIKLDIFKIVEIAIKNDKVNISKDKLVNIYEAETSYLKFIGVVD